MEKHKEKKGEEKEEMSKDKKVRLIGMFKAPVVHRMGAFRGGSLHSTYLTDIWSNHCEEVNAVKMVELLSGMKEFSDTHVMTYQLYHDYFYQTLLHVVLCPFASLCLQQKSWTY